MNPLRLSEFTYVTGLILITASAYYSDLCWHVILDYAKLCLRTTQVAKLPEYYIEMIGFRANSVLELPPPIPSYAQIERRRKGRLKIALGRTLDRVNVLGKDRRQGHTGSDRSLPLGSIDTEFNSVYRCVNALSWGRGGEFLLSGGDDTTVRIWKMDTSNLSQEYPFISRCTIQTGHEANIFSAQMLPHSSRMYVHPFCNSPGQVID